MVNAKTACDKPLNTSESKHSMWLKNSQKLNYEKNKKRKKNRFVLYENQF